MKPMPSVSSSSEAAAASSMTPCAFPSLAVDPVTGVDPVLFRGDHLLHQSPSNQSNGQRRFQRKPPVVDRAREYASSRSHAATRETLERLRERHHELQIEREEAFDREAQRRQFVASFVETRLATCGVPTINSMDVRIQRERERVERLESETETARDERKRDPSVVARERIQRAVRETYGSRTLNLMALELTHVPREVFTTLLLQLGRFVATVNVSRNALRTLPDAFIAAFPQVETLNVKENALDSLPLSLATLSSLRVLFAECNALRQLPPRGLPRSLERLVLSRNRLRSVPQMHTLSRLTALELTHNLLQVLPPGVDCLVQLRSMDVSSNQLVTLALLPRVMTPPATTAKDERALEDSATLSPEQREREQKKWRVELDPDTDERIYFHTETKEVTRVRPACFRPPVPTLPIGRRATHHQLKLQSNAMYPDGWDITLAGRSLVVAPSAAQVTTTATTVDTSLEKETASASSAESLQSMELRFVHHPTARSLESLPPELDRWDQLKYLNTLRLAGNQLLDLPPSLVRSLDVVARLMLTDGLTD
ncbi:hypothetical protein PINS_up001237 [Pythium insidiosum]|nr:hypothetical protein PINS_up001237 [Pythium insidiosum]